MTTQSIMKGKNTMKIKFDLTGTTRKALVKAISEITGAKAKYLFTPTYAYEIDYFTVTREGALEFDDHADSEEIETLLERLDAQGFRAVPAGNFADENAPTEEVPTPVESTEQGAFVNEHVAVDGAESTSSEGVPTATESTEQGAPVSEHVAVEGSECAPVEETPIPMESAEQGALVGLKTASTELAAQPIGLRAQPIGLRAQPICLTIAMPLDKVNAGNLTNLLDAKGKLIQKALGIDATPIEISEDAVSFPWFPETPDADTVQAVTHFIAALCKISVEQRRISPVEKPADNEKYAFRCFLLRLGFIGAEYKTERKILLQNLTGNSAFKSGAKREATNDEISE